MFTSDKHCLQQETSGVVYSTVDFTTVEQAKVHKDPSMQETQAEGRNPNCSSEPEEWVEYSVLTCHQWRRVKQFLMENYGQSTIFFKILWVWSGDT